MQCGEPGKCSEAGRAIAVRLRSALLANLLTTLRSDPFSFHELGLKHCFDFLAIFSRGVAGGGWRPLPALGPAFVASGAIAFATAMGAFGTAFTLATNIDVLPMLIYTEFTLSANIAISAALSVGLGLVAWAVLALARSFGGNSVAAAG